MFKGFLFNEVGVFLFMIKIASRDCFIPPAAGLAMTVSEKRTPRGEGFGFYCCCFGLHLFASHLSSMEAMKLMEAPVVAMMAVSRRFSPGMFGRMLQAVPPRKLRRWVSITMLTSRGRAGGLIPGGLLLRSNRGRCHRCL